MSKRPDFLTDPVPVTMCNKALPSAPVSLELAARFLVRRAHVEEAGDLSTLLGGAFAAETWEPEGTRQELFHDETVKVVLVVEVDRRLVATASLQQRAETPNTGWIRWVATERAWRRHGLARSLVIELLSAARQAGCVDARLHTESDRLAAISLYRQLGFEPLIEDDSQVEVWDRVFAILDQERHALPENC